MLDLTLNIVSQSETLIVVKKSSLSSLFNVRQLVIPLKALVLGVTQAA